MSNADGSLNVETTRRLNAWVKGRDAGIRECIETLLSMPVQHWSYDEITDIYMECIRVDSAVDALRTLLEGGLAE